MRNRESILPLIVGLLASLVVHIAVAAGFVTLGDMSTEVGLPDLVVTGLRTSEPRMVGRSTRITVALEQARAGDFKAAVTVRLYIDRAPVAERRVGADAIERGQAELRFDYTAEAEGMHQVRAVVDEENRILEFDEGNNETTQSFRWLTPSAADAPDLVAVDLSPVGEPVAGRPVRLAARFANIGDRPAPPDSIVLSIDGEPVHRVSITEPLEPGGSFLLRQWLEVDDPGAHTIDAFVDADDRTPEPDEINNRLRRTIVWAEPPPEKVVLGQDEPSPVRINWISYEDYRKLIARRSRMDQAMVQKTTEPQLLARVPVEPTPLQVTHVAAPVEPALATSVRAESPSPLPTEVRLPEVSIRTDVAAVVVRPEVNRTPSEAKAPELPVAMKVLPPLELVTDAAEIELAERAPAEDQSPTGPTATEVPARPRPAKPQAAALLRTDSPRPTSAPRDKREAVAVTRLGSVELKPGGVIARPGIRIDTARPRFGPIAARSSAPVNPDVQITFNREGRVVRARFLKSTGYSNVDGPLLLSLYKWTASGKKFQALEETLTVQIRILLMEE